MMLSGKGMFTWRLANCEGGDMRIVVNQLRKMQATHILVKIADGTRYYHENDPYLDDLFMLCHEANIKVLGWQYVYGDRPVEEASAAINALQSLPYDGFVVNAEKEYADIRKEAAAEVYCQFIRNAYDGLFALSSYRAPWLHPNFPFAQFLSCVDLNMPQVYWMQSEGFAPWELDRMEHQFAHSRYPQVPLFPTGAAFQEHGWQAKPEDVRTFIQESECRGYQGVNFWRYEQAFHRLPELGKAIAETPYKTKENTMDILFRARCKVSSLRIRRGPGTSHAVVGWISQGHIVDVFEVSNGWYRIGANRWVSGDDSYMERITDEMPEPDTEPLQSLYYPLDERWPVSQVFGVNPHWYPNTKGHNGVDFAVPVGNPIYAAADGKVIVARSETSGYGRHIRIRHSHGVTIYGHMSRNDVKVGDEVKAKQIIGLSGGAVDDPYSGMSTGPHLHFECRLDKQAPQVPGGYLYNAIDPMPLLVSHDDADTLFRAKCITASLRVRILPTTDANSTIVGHLVEGQTVNVVEVSENGWYRIGVSRWVSGDENYMERLDEPEPPTIPTPPQEHDLDWLINIHENPDLHP